MPQTPIKKGISTIFWGTDTLTQGAAGSIVGAIVESISIKDVPVKGRIEFGVGTEASKVLVDDGFDAALKLVYDSAITYPVLGDLISLKTPRYGATKKAVVVVGINEEIARKKEAMIGFDVEFRPDLGLVAP